MNKGVGPAHLREYLELLAADYRTKRGRGPAIPGRSPAWFFPASDAGIPRIGHQVAVKVYTEWVCGEAVAARMTLRYCARRNLSWHLDVQASTKARYYHTAASP